MAARAPKLSGAKGLSRVCERTLSVDLMAAKGREGFYKQFGFTVYPNDRLGAGMELWLTGE